MAERIIAPGVYTKEIDQSFLPGAIAQIGAAIVGPTLKGPALVPTAITSFSEYERIFGSYTTDSYVPFVVSEYLKNGGPVITVTRLLYEDGYNYQNGVLAVIASSGSGATKVEKVTHVLHPVNQVKGDTAALAAGVFADSVINNYQSGSFSIKLSGSYDQHSSPSTYTIYSTEGTAVSASINPSANTYVTKVFGQSPKSKDYPVYVQYEDQNAYASFANPADISIKLSVYSTYDFRDDYQTASTPWITSQKIGSTTKNLIKFHTISHGTSTNHEVKIGIKDIKLGSEISDPDGYPTFTVSVRRVNTSNIPNSPYNSSETDTSPDILEEFNVNLNPMSTKYIASVIGDKYYQISADGNLIQKGDFPNLSRYIRVEVDDNVKNINNSKDLIPFGFRAPVSTIPMASGSVNFAAASYVTSQTSKSTYHGFNFANTTNLVYLNAIPSGSVTASNTDFYLGDVSQTAVVGTYTGSLESVLVAGTFASNVELAARKFIVPMQGGFDGARPNLPKYAGADITNSNTFGFDCSGATSSGTIAYKKAFSILSNSDYYDINMLLTPGILNEEHSHVTAAARTLVEERMDTFYVMDLCTIDKSVSHVKTHALSVDSNYTAAYWPWLRVTNPANGIPTWVPPSVLMPGVLAFNDANAAPWYAPAGLTRGGLTLATDTYTNLSNANRGELYENRVNPIANFPANGIVVWGQKTLQSRKSALSSVNVRRLLIAVKKFIASSTRFLVFEQNTFETRKRFLDIVNPYLTSVSANQGLYAFKVIMDESNNTPDLIDQNILYGQLFLQPTRTAEFILLDFNIQPTGASFPE